MLSVSEARSNEGKHNMSKKSTAEVIQINPKPRKRCRPTKADLEIELMDLRSEKEAREAVTPVEARATAAAIPVMAGMLGWVAAEVAALGNWLALLPAVMTFALLSVSLPHVAKGLKRKLCIEAREAWALAVAVDLAMVTCESVLHFSEVGTTARTVCWAVMTLGLVGSTAFNVAGFSRK